MQPDVLKRNDTYYLKKDFYLSDNQESKVRFLFRAGTPLAFISKIDIYGGIKFLYRFQIVGSFASVEVDDSVFNDTIGDFWEEGLRSAK